MGDEDVADTSAEPVEASPVAPEVSPEVAPADTEAAPAPETKPELGEEEQKQVDAVVSQIADKTFPETVVTPEDDKVVLSKVELAERDRRNQQSAADRARADAEAQAQAREQAARDEYMRRQQLHQQISVLAKTSLDENGELKPDFADAVLAGHEGIIQQRAMVSAMAQQDSVLISAVRGAEFMQNADWTAMQKPAQSRVEEVGQLLEVVYNTGKSAMKSEMEAEVERRANALAKTKAAAMTKEALQQLRANQPNGDLPSGSAPPGRITDEELAKHQGDAAWWEANREKYFAQQGLKK